MSDNRVGYLPQELAGALRRWAPPEISDGEMYSLLRLAERIYAEGYDAGHLRGHDEARDLAGRPNGNDVNRAREALAERGKTADA
jgi:hypothetical protein